MSNEANINVRGMKEMVWERIMENCMNCYTPSLRETCIIKAPEEQMLGIRRSAETHSKRTDTFWKCRHLFHIYSLLSAHLVEQDIEELLNQ